MKPFVDSGQLVMLGVIQEQHADRCQLFQQWKGLDFPIVQDALNSNGIQVVPVYVAIDEHGIVQRRPRNPKTFVADFIEQDFDAPTEKPPVVDVQLATVTHWRQQLTQSDSTENRIRLADSLIVWDGNKAAVREATKLYERAGQADPNRSDIRFRLGVARRLLYELDGRSDASKFARSLVDWEAALQLNPNHYIYRRRIEQYGPRLKKPYSFYDWVSDARREIEERGDTPYELLVEPNGAELARPAKQMVSDSEATNPDPRGRITRDDRFTDVHINMVPSQPRAGDVVAIHVGFNISDPAKWNHETTPLQMWVDRPAGQLRLSSQLIVDHAEYRVPESQAPLSLSFELQIPKKHEGNIQLNAFALFNLCESEGGQCLYRRRDFTIEVPY